MAKFDNNGNIFFSDGWMLRTDGTFIPANLVEEVGLPAGDWLRRVRAYLLQRKDALAITDVKCVEGPIGQAPRVFLDITFDTRPEQPSRHDSWALLEQTWAAVKEQNGYGFYDYQQAFQIVESAVTIFKGER